MSNSYSNFGHGGRENHHKGYDYDRRNSRAGHQLDGQILDLLTRIRSWKPYLQKRLIMIQESGQTKLLRDDVRDIQRWLEIAGDVKADVIYSVADLEEALSKMLDMIRVHPILEPPKARLDSSDESDDGAPRSPSPGLINNDVTSNTRIIPLESSRNSPEWNTNRDHHSNSSSTRPGDPGFERSRHDRSNDWGSQRTESFGSRGDTDMRIPSRYEAFQPSTADRRTGRERQTDDRKFNETEGRPRSSNYNDNNLWDRYRRQSGDRSNDRSPGHDPRQTRQIENTSDKQGGRCNIEARDKDDKGRMFLKDQDYRDSSRSVELIPRNPNDTKILRDKERYSNDKGWMRIRDRSSEQGRSRDGDSDTRNSFGDSDFRAGTNRRGLDYARREPDAKDKWNNCGPNLPPRRDERVGSPAYRSSSPLPSTAGPPTFQTQNPFANPFVIADNSRLHQISSPPLNQNATTMNIGSRQSPIARNVDHSASPLYSPMSPTNSANSRPGLLGNPPGITNITGNQLYPPNFSTPLNHMVRPPTPVNPFDPRARPGPEISLENLKAKAQQHFSRNTRPRTPRPPIISHPPKQPPPPAGSNALANPNLATNQIAAPLPTDPRRLSQLQRLKQQQQQQQQSSGSSTNSSSNSTAPLQDPRQRRLANAELVKEPKLSAVNDKGFERLRESDPLSKSDTQTEKDKNKITKIQELRQSVSNQTLHRLGPRGKNQMDTENIGDTIASIDDKYSHENHSDKPNRSSRSDSPEIKRSRRSSGQQNESKSPPRRLSKSAQNFEEERKDPRTRNKTVVSPSPSSNEKELRSKSSSNSQSSKRNVTPSVSQNSVLSFRIPKIKKPDPPPEEIISLSSRSPSPEIHIAPANSDASQELQDHDDRGLSIASPSPEPDTSVESSETVIQVEKTATETAKTSRQDDDTSADTDVLLRQFLMKTFSENVVGQILGNSDALDKIKRLLTDQIPALVIPTPSTTSAIETPDGPEVEEESQVTNDGSNAAAEDEPICSRGRSVGRKRTHRRRSSLERLHDALREMNFDAVLPLGPRRHTRTHGDETGAQDHSESIAECIESVIDSAVKSKVQKKDCTNSVAQETLPIKSEESDAETLSTTDNSQPSKGKPARARKRKRPFGMGPSKKKKGRKAIGTVTAEAAKIAASAICVEPAGEAVAAKEDPDAPVGETSTTASTSPKKGKKGSPTESTRKGLRAKPARPPPDVSEVRVTRSRAKPIRRSIDVGEAADSKVDTEDALSVPFEPEIASDEKTLNNEDDGKTDDTVEVSASEKNDASVHDVPIDFQPDVTEAALTPRSLKELSQPLSSNDLSLQVFQCDNYGDENILRCIERHEKLLGDFGASIKPVSVSSNSVFDQYLKAVESEKAMASAREQSYSQSFASNEIPTECVNVMDWIISVVEYKVLRSEPQISSDADDNSSTDLTDLFYDENEDSSHVVIKREKSIDSNDNDSEDEGEIRFEDLFGSGNSDDVSQVFKEEFETPLKIDVDAEFADTSSLSPTIGMGSQEEACLSAIVDSETIGDQFVTAILNDDEDISIEPATYDDENDSNRKTNLEGHDLYRCANQDCKFTGASGNAFKEHALTCASETRMFQCFHCERRVKSMISLMEHLKIHGKPRQLCSMCDFSGWFSSELTKHMKNAHKVYNLKTVTELREDEDPVQVTYAKEVASRLATPQDLTLNHVLYTSKVQFRPSEIDSIPRACIFSSLVHCAVCDYATKVRSNIIRHLNLHSIAENDGGSTEVPDRAPVNPVPCLERKEMMFDKMTNWAGSSHATKIGGVSKEDTLKLPKFVPDQFRYMCSVASCRQITGQDDILGTHMKALHFKEKFYQCPHCQEEEGTKSDPRNVVPLEKISHHLRLHGPRLSKCGHCDYIHYSSPSMEKHIATKHIEKKPIFYLIRDLDSDGNSLTRRSSVDDPTKSSSERWRCTLCKAYSSSWSEAKSHCSDAHKIYNQFYCSICHFSCDSIYAISNHIMNKACRSDKVPAKVLIMFYRCESNEGMETKSDEAGNVPLWRRDAPRVKHIRGIFLDEENHRKSAVSNSSTSSSSKQPPKLVPAVTPNVPKPVQAPIQLVCPKCNVYKAKNPADLKVHLFNEMNYLRYQCTTCTVKAVTMDSLKAHMSNDHKITVDESSMTVLPVNEQIETQVFEMINKIVTSQKPTDDKDGRNTENLLCKHCYIQITSYHNYRTHVLAKHIGSERFRCQYCQAGFWNEGMLKIHHSKSPHAHLPVGSIKDDEFEKKLTPEFWLNEYGIPLNKSVNPGSASPQKASRSNSGSSISELRPNSTKEKGSPQKQPGGKNKSLTIANDGGKSRNIDSIQGAMKNFKELSNIYKCEFCSSSNFTQRGMRSHWQRDHLMDEQQCRYFKCRSYDDKLNLNDGYAIKCSNCPYQSISIEYFHLHHEAEHKGQPCRFKRKKRCDFKNKSNQVKMFICNRCHCECESELNLKAHNSRSHHGTPLVFRTEEVVPSIPTSGAIQSESLIVENVGTECPICSKEFENLHLYMDHFAQEHGQDYMEPHLKFIRLYASEEKEVSPSKAVRENPSASSLERVEPVVRKYPPVVRKEKFQPSNNANSGNEELAKRSTDSTPGPSMVEKLHASFASVTQQEFMYECPKCDFKSDDGDYVRNQHLITHLLAYRCPECNLAFHLSVEAQFHIRHFHGIPRIRPTHNKDAYVEFSALKGKVTKVPMPSKNVVVVNISDDDDYNGARAASPMPTVEDLANMDIDFGLLL